jgi:hypothetical protein
MEAEIVTVIPDEPVQPAMPATGAVGPAMPNLFTGTSSPPNAATASGTIRSISERFPLLQRVANRTGISIFAASIVYPLIPVMNTAAPAAENARQSQARFSSQSRSSCSALIPGSLSAVSEVLVQAGLAPGIRTKRPGLETDYMAFARAYPAQSDPVMNQRNRAHSPDIPG